MYLLKNSNDARFLTLVLASLFLVSLGMISHNAFADTAMATVPVGSWPYGIGVNPNTNMVYVANSQSGTVSVIDGGTNEVIATVASGSYPIGVAVNPNTNMVYVNNNMGGTVSVINGTSNTVVATISNVGSSNDISVNPNTNMVYVSENGMNSLAVINGSTNKIVTTIPVGSNPDGVAINPVTNIIYVANQASNTTSVIDGATNTVTSTINVGNWPSHIAVNPNTNSVYVTNFYGGTVSVIDGATNTVTKTINVGNNPIGIGINSNTKMIYVANNKDGTVSIIDGSTNNVAQVLTVGESPVGVGINSNTNEVYVSNGYTSNGSVYVIKGGSSNVSAPSAPQNLQAVSGNAQVNLSWTASSSNGGSPITNYKIYRSASSGSETLLATAGNVTSYVDNTVTNGQQYFYKVSAVNSVGESPQSNEASVMPMAPSTSSGPVTATIPVNGSYGVAVNSNTDKTYVANSGFYIQAIDGKTNSVTAPIRVHSPPPTLIGAGACTTQFVTVDPITNMIYTSNGGCHGKNCYDCGGYSVLTSVSVINGTNNTLVTTIPFSYCQIGSSSPLVVNPVTNKIYAIDKTNCYANVGLVPQVDIIDGNSWQIISQVSANAYDLAVNPQINMIYALGGNTIYVIDGTTNSIVKSFSWGKSSNNGIGVNPSTNLIYVSNSDNSVSVIDGSTYQVTANIPNVGYGFVSVNAVTNKIYVGSLNSNTVTVINGETNTVSSIPVGSDPYGIGINTDTNKIYVGNSGSSTVSVIDGSTSSGMTNPPSAPSAPQNLGAAAASSSQIDLIWTAPANNGGSQITGYTIQRSTDGGATWSTIASNTGSTVTKYNDTGLSPDTTYTYQVSAINSAGTSAPSNTAFATTTSITIASGIVLNNVQSTSGTTSSSNQITLSGFNAGTGSNQLLLVGISANNNSPVSVTFNGVQLTQAVGSFYNNDAEFWYLKNSTGTGDIIVTMGGPTQVVVGAYSLSGVNQTAPIPTHVAKHNTTPNSPNISITTKYANDMVLDLPSIYGGSTLGSPTCTQQWNANMPNAITGASSSTTVQSPATVTCKWTASSADFWDDVAVELRAAG